MQLRQASVDDLQTLLKIYKKSYANDFPLDFSTSFAQVVAEDGGILGFGWLDLVVEANIILDLEARPRDKFSALRGIVEYGENVSRRAGFNQMHVFPKDEKFSAVLKKHLQFNDITGDCLVKNLDNGEKR